MDNCLPLPLSLSDLIALEDPNKARPNRTPTESEMRGLCSLADSHARIASFLETELSRAEAVHQSIRTRYEEQFSELEATRSQMHQSHQLISTLSTHRDQIRGELARITSILHPLRRFPSDILQCIFETCTQASEMPLAVAITLSHVCQRWRTIALSTPRLWNRIIFSTDRNSNDIRAFWEWISPRVRNVETTVQLKDNVYKTSLGLHNCPLTLIPNLVTLDIILSEIYLIFEVIDVKFQVPPIKKLIIRNNSSDLDEITKLEQEVFIGWRLEKLLDRFESLEQLDIGDIPTMTQSPEHGRVFSQIKVLSLGYTGPLYILSILASFPQLEKVSFGHVETVVAAGQTPVVHQSLHILQINSFDDESWLPFLSCPSLTALVTASEDPHHFFNFIERHPTLERIEMENCEGLLKKLTEIAPQIKHMGQSGSWTDFSNWANRGFHEPPLPSLEVATMMDDLNDLSAITFEAIVRSRALPSFHPQSLLHPSLAPLKEIHVLIKPESLDSVILDRWKATEYYHSAKKRFVKAEMWDDCEEIILSWV
ncbi:hypothetical protein FS842_009630 [Serendipita sp. 407]|nr:hypothetical protein FS842_009630 [Serendipita sp. 407]